MGSGAETRAGYGAAVRLMWETSHPLSFAVAGYALAASIMPNLVLIAAGHLVGSIPAASASGLGSAAGHRLVFALAVTGALYAAALVLGRSFTGGQELSGGQWQRLALARGMMRDLPLLLMLDEPTASLDAITEAALFERYLSARQLASQSGAITLLVSHRFSTVRMADLIVVLDQGRITASGDHASLIRAGGLYAELYELQARAYR